MNVSRRPNVLVYTDSRGQDLTSRVAKNLSHKLGLRSYVTRLRRHFRVEATICPERHTTLLDFLDYVERRGNDYDAIVLHCGIVDFSPRPLSNVTRVRESKAHLVDLELMTRVRSDGPGAVPEGEYEGEPTTTIYTKDFLAGTIIPRLRSIPKLLWISSNDFVSGWEGNYTRGRPANIDEVVRGFDEMLAASLPNIVSLRSWTDADIQRWTIDNIHFTQSGFRVLGDLLVADLKRLTA